MKMIKNFNIFLLLESILKADDDVINILNKIKDSSLIANELLHLINKDIKTNTNYYKLINGKNDELHFINNSQVDRLLAANEDPFKKAKNGMKIGRLARQVLELNGSKISDVELNKFVDHWKAAIDGKDIKEENFAFVQGEKIQHWYDYNQYLKQMGTLGNSCMRDPNKSNYLNIYSNNPEVCSLLILKENDKLIARALVWKLKKPVNGFDYYLDRIYTINDSDVNVLTDIYIEWLRKNNSIKNFKKEDVLCYTTLETKVEVKLNKWKFERYPYMDSFEFFKIKEGELTNKIKDSDKEKYPMWYLQNQYGNPSAYNGWRYIKSENEFFDEDDLIKLDGNNYELKSNYIRDYFDEWIKKDEAVESDYGWIKKTSLISIDGKTGPKEDVIIIGDSYKEVVEEVEDYDDYSSYDPRDYRGKDMSLYDYMQRMKGNKDIYGNYYNKSTRNVTKYEIENKQTVFKKFIKVDDYVYVDNTSCYIKKSSMFFYIDSNRWQNIDSIKLDDCIRLYRKKSFNAQYLHRISNAQSVGFDIKNLNIEDSIKDINIQYKGLSIRSLPYSFEQDEKYNDDIIYCSKDYLYDIFEIFPIELMQKQEFITDKKIEKKIIRVLKSESGYKSSLKKYDLIKNEKVIEYFIKNSMDYVSKSIEKVFLIFLYWLERYSYDYISWDCNPEDLILPAFIAGMRSRMSLPHDTVLNLCYELCPFLKDNDAFVPINRTLHNEYSHYFTRNSEQYVIEFLSPIDSLVSDLFIDNKEVFEKYFKKNYKNYLDNLILKIKENKEFKNLKRKSD